MLLKVFIVTLFIVSQLALAAPPNDKALFDPDNPESRKRHNNRRRRPNPCVGRNNPNEQGRTFFDWSLSYVDVNYNYNINCGGGAGGGQHDGGGPQKPILSSIFQGGNRPTGGSTPGGSHGNGPLSFVQQQVQGIFSNGQGISSLLPQGGIFNGEGVGSWLPQVGSLLPQGGLFEGLNSWIPQGGLFNGQGITSLFENGLFSNIFNGPSNSPTAPTAAPPPVTTSKPDVQDPDDIIYNDEKPVHEDHDDVVPDHYNRPAPYNSYRPRQYQNRQYQNGRSNNVRFL